MTEFIGTVLVLFVLLSLWILFLKQQILAERDLQAAQKQQIESLQAALHSASLPTRTIAPSGSCREETAEVYDDYRN